MKIEKLISFFLYCYFRFKSGCWAFFVSLIIFLAQNTTLLAGNQLTVAIIGDSLTQGYGLKETENFVSVLHQKLSENKHEVQLINFGVSGDTTTGGLERFEWSISSGIDGVVINLGANDMLRGIRPEITYANLKKMVLLARNKGLPVLLIGVDAGNNYGEDYKLKFQESFSKLKEEFNLLLYPNFFKSLLSDDTSHFLSFMQSDNIHPNKEGVERIVSDFYPFMEIFLAKVKLANL